VSTAPEQAGRYNQGWDPCSRFGHSSADSNSEPCLAWGLCRGAWVGAACSSYSGFQREPEAEAALGSWVALAAGEPPGRALDDTQESRHLGDWNATRLGGVDGESPSRNDRPVAPGQLGADRVDRRGELDDPSRACTAKRIVARRLEGDGIEADRREQIAYSEAGELASEEP